MAKTLTQILEEIVVRCDDQEHRLDNLLEKVEGLLKEVKGLMNAPAPRRGAKVPPTPLPETLDKLGIGSDPKGT
jgi:hypothetical protein